MTGLAVKAATLRLGQRTILSGATLTAPAGRLTGLVGPNGAGKSTLLAAMLGLRPLASGSIHFAGRDLPSMPPPERARLCAFVEQFANTPERLTVRDAVALGRIPFQSAWQTTPTPEDIAITDAALAELGLAAFANRLYHSLSGGEQQRVQLARALAQAPHLLLLDEPTSHLDIQAQLLVLDLLRRRSRAGCTVLLALHDLNLAARYCDHLVVMRAGAVVAEGAPTAVLTPELLLNVYGVHAAIVQLPGSTHPLVVYDRAELPESD